MATIIIDNQQYELEIPELPSFDDYEQALANLQSGTGNRGADLDIIADYVNGLNACNLLLAAIHQNVLQIVEPSVYRVAFQGWAEILLNQGALRPIEAANRYKM